MPQNSPTHNNLIHKPVLTPKPTPQALAEQVRDAMWPGDHATRMLGMRIVSVAPGSAVIEMVVRQDMLNGHAICHGGLIATLADSSFAFACNSYNEVTVASGFAIDLLAPGRLADTLTATCTERSKSGRTGVYDTEVRNQRGETIALFRGRSYTARGKPVVQAPPDLPDLPEPPDQAQD